MEKAVVHMSQGKCVYIDKLVHLQLTCINEYTKLIIVKYSNDHRHEKVCQTWGAEGFLIEVPYSLNILREKIFADFEVF